MIRVVYIAGRYRHTLPDGQPNNPAMFSELYDEAYWAAIAADCGMMPFSPLANSANVMAELSHEDWIDLDLGFIRQMPPKLSLILMRPGWDSEPESVGARKEFDVAQECGIKVVHAKLGEDVVIKYLTELDMCDEDAADLALVKERLNEPTEPLDYEKEMERLL